MLWEYQLVWLVLEERTSSSMLPAMYKAPWEVLGTRSDKNRVEGRKKKREREGKKKFSLSGAYS